MITLKKIKLNNFNNLKTTGTIDDKCQLLEFAKLGCYTQFDLFGTECSFYQLDEKINMPSDAQRLDRINWIKQDNGVDKILMSHDIHTKHRLVNLFIFIL